jgi:hypothetical protein
MLTHPRVKDSASRREQTQSPKYFAANSHESHPTGHDVGDMPVVDRKFHEGGGARRVVRRPFERRFKGWLWPSKRTKTTESD